MYNLWEHIKQLTIRTLLKHKKSKLERYIVPLLFVFIILVTKSVLNLFIGNITSYHLLLLPVILSAWYGGLGPGILATITIGVLNDYFFLWPNSPIYTHESIVLTIIFIIEGLLISVICEAMIQANKKKDEFIGLASHELKTPLTIIQMFADLIYKNTKEKQTKKAGQHILEQVEKTKNLIKDLLNITNMESGKLVYHKEKFCINDLLENIIKEQKKVVTTHKIIFKNAPRRNIYGDRYRIGQVFTNLISNAVKYSPNSNKINISIINKQKSVLISVQDFGYGIDEKSKQKIFNRYFRTEKAEKRKIQGLGLGLYISAEIIKEHTGKLWVESKIGKGSTFSFTIPIANKT